MYLYLEEVTGLKHWPWSNCDAVFKEAGFKFTLLPGAQSVEETFKTKSNNISRAKLLAIKSDLANNLIHLAQINQPSSPQTQSTENTEHVANTETANNSDIQ